MQHTSEKFKVDRNTSEVLKQFNAMPKSCFNEFIQSFFPEANYLMAKSSGNAVIITANKGNFIVYNRFEF